MEANRALKILIVDDDEDTRINLTDILELDGHQVSTVGSIAGLLAHSDLNRFEAIILDRRLPDGDAQEAIPKLNEHVPDIPIVVVTGYPDLGDAIAAIRNGAYDYLLKPINPDGLRASLNRIAERRETINELRLQRDFAEGLVETAQSIVLVLDNDGNIVRFNNFMSELSGFALEEVRGRSWFDVFIPVGEKERIWEVFRTAVSGQPIHANINPILTKSGEQREVSWWSTALRDEHGEITGVLAVGHDITALRHAEKKLVQHERLAAIGQMVTGLAHESRNAFQRSQACLEMLELEIDDRPSALVLVNKIQKALDHLHHLYEEVRDYAAPLNLRCDRHDLSSLWRETWSLIDHSTDAGPVKLVEELATDALECNVDREAMHQVFRNLFENAVAACADDGQITVSVSDDVLDGDPALSIRVCDNGAGLPSNVRGKVFEPFFTTKTKGTGLGLAITQRIVQAHEGTISVGDGPMGGAEFRIRLPRAASVSN